MPFPVHVGLANGRKKYSCLQVKITICSFSGLAAWPPEADQQRQDEQRVSQDEPGEALEAPADDDDGRRPGVGARHRQDLRLRQDGEARLPNLGGVRLAQRKGTVN